MIHEDGLSTKEREQTLEPKKVAKFKQVLNTCEDGIAILLAQVDPDGVGSSALLSRVLQALGKQSVSYYAGVVSQLNQAIFNLFELDKIMHPTPPTALSSQMAVALVDSAMVDDRRFGVLGPISPKFVIDHHRTNLAEREDNWVCIESVGAAATLVAELLFALDVPLSDDPSTATLGALGIAGDTDDFKAPETTSRDRAMFSRLMEHGDQELYTRARDYFLPDRYFEILEGVLKSRKSGHSTMVASGGYIAEDEKDFLARIANNLSRRTGTELLIVWAVVDESKLVVKARTRDASKNLNEMLKKKFGESRAGAKTWAGGAEIKLDLKPSFSASSRNLLLEYLESWMLDEFHIPR